MAAEANQSDTSDAEFYDAHETEDLHPIDLGPSKALAHSDCPSIPASNFPSTAIVTDNPSSPGQTRAAITTSSSGSIEFSALTPCPEPSPQGPSMLQPSPEPLQSSVHPSAPQMVGSLSSLGSKSLGFNDLSIADSTDSDEASVPCLATTARVQVPAAGPCQASPRSETPGNGSRVSSDLSGMSIPGENPQLGFLHFNGQNVSPSARHRRDSTTVESVPFRNLDTGKTIQIPVQSLQKIVEKQHEDFLQAFGETIRHAEEESSQTSSLGRSESSCSGPSPGKRHPQVIRGTLRSLWSKAQLRKPAKSQERGFDANDLDPRHKRTPSETASSRVRHLMSKLSLKQPAHRDQSSQTSVSGHSEASYLRGEFSDASEDLPDTLRSQSRAGERPHSELKSEGGNLKSWYRHLLPHSVDFASLPHHVEVKSNFYRDVCCWTNLWLVQELRTPHQLPVWCISVHDTGRWIAAGTQAGTVHIWCIASVVNLSELSFPPRSAASSHSTSPEKADLETITLSSGPDSCGTSSRQDTLMSTQKQAPDEKGVTGMFETVLTPNPVLDLHGHQETVVSCAWDNRLTELDGCRLRLGTASLDQTVKIWMITLHTESLELVQTLTIDCADWATSVVFHPTIPHFFFTSSLNGTVKLWQFYDTATQKGPRAKWALNQPLAGSTPLTVEPVESIKMSDLITAMAVSPNGLLLAVGLSSGRVSLYETKTLRFCSELECRNRRGRFASGRKVTGIDWTQDSCSICVTTNDSRIRIIHLNDISNWLKYKGLSNTQIMLSAQLSASEQYLICGSEPNWIYTWNVDMASLRQAASELALMSTKLPTNRDYARFKAFNEPLTSTCVPPPGFVVQLAEHLKKVNLPESKKMDMLGATTSGAIGRNGGAILAGSAKGAIRVFVNFTSP